MKKITKSEIELLVPSKYSKNFKLPKYFEKIDWDDTDFLGWVHPSGHLGYILEDLSGIHKLWVFYCNPHKSGSKKANICPVCLSVHTGETVGVKIFSKKHNIRKNESIGQYFCGDLNCNYWVRIIKTNTMRENLSVEERRLRMLSNLEERLKNFG